MTIMIMISTIFLELQRIMSIKVMLVRALRGIIQQASITVSKA
jgi:hypothetical protein